MFEAINSMLLDMLAAVARKDYDDRRRRQAQGQAKAKAEGRYKGRVEDLARNAGIASMLKAGQSWSAIQAATVAGQRPQRSLNGTPRRLDRSLQAHLGHSNIQNTTRYTALASGRFKNFWRD
jgi:hypothetical protein